MPAPHITLIQNVMFKAQFTADVTELDRQSEEDIISDIIVNLPDGKHIDSIELDIVTPDSFSIDEEIVFSPTLFVTISLVQSKITGTEINQIEEAISTSVSHLQPSSVSFDEVNTEKHRKMPAQFRHIG